MSSKPSGYSQAFGGGHNTGKAAGIRRLFASSDRLKIRGQLEPLGAAPAAMIPARPAIPAWPAEVGAVAAPLSAGSEITSPLSAGPWPTDGVAGRGSAGDGPKSVMPGRFFIAVAG